MSEGAPGSGAGTEPNAGQGQPLRVVFMGSPEFAVPSLRALLAVHQVVAVVTQPDKPAGRGKSVQAPPVKLEAGRAGLTVLQPTRLLGPEGEALVSQLQPLLPDVLIVVAYGKILQPELLALPRLGPFNVHASLLPRYRGAAPIQWAVMRGETRTGVSIMRMEAGLDTGPVLAMRETPIGDEETAGELFGRLAVLGAELLIETLAHIAAGTAVETPQEHARATLAPMLRKEDGRLDFDRPAPVVSAHARGVDPWPGAFALFEGEPLKLFRPRVLTAADGSARPIAPGTIVAAGAQGLVVQCKTGQLAFSELQFPGRKRLPVQAALAGRAIPAGTRLA